MSETLYGGNTANELRLLFHEAGKAANTFNNTLYDLAGVKAVAVACQPELGKAYKCPNCNGNFYLYERTCSVCKDSGLVYILPAPREKNKL